jgi:hypothetical protein
MSGNQLGALLSARREDLHLPSLLGGKVLFVLGHSEQIVRERKIILDVQGIAGDKACQVEAVEVSCNHLDKPWRAS